MSVEDWWRNSPALAMLAAERVADFLELYNNEDIKAGMGYILSNEEEAFQFKMALAKVISDNPDLMIFPNKG